MKKKEGVFIFVFLAVMVVWAIQPAWLYSGEFGGNPWDFLIDPGSSTGTKWSGPLSIYYDYTGSCGTNNPLAKLYFTVRLAHQGVAPYVFYGVSSQPICRSEKDQQGDALRSFLNDALYDIYGTPKIWKPDGAGDWRLKSIQNAVLLFDDTLPNGSIVLGGTFIADIQIAVNE